MYTVYHQEIPGSSKPISDEADPIVNPFRRNPQAVYESKLEEVWEESLDKEQVELFCKGIVDEVVTAVMQQAENRKRNKSWHSWTHQ